MPTYKIVMRPTKKKGGKHKRKMHGKGIFDGVNNWLKQNKVLSKIGNFVQSTGLAGAFNPLLKGATDYASQQGYGRRRRKMYGGNVPYGTINSSYSRVRF